MRRLLLCVLMLCAAFYSALAGGSGENQKNQGSLQVVTTNFPPYDFVRAMGGDRVQLSMLLPPGAESHSFEPTPRDIITIQNCDVFIYTGGENDAWVDRILSSMDTSQMRIIKMMDCVKVVEEKIVEGMEEEGDPTGPSEFPAETPQSEEGEEEPEYDEHVWTSPKNAILIVEAISKTLCEVDSANADAYREGSKALVQGLKALDQEFQQVVDGAKRRVMVFGDRFPFRYFADAYGLSYYAAFPGCSTDTEPSAATVAFLIDKIRELKIPVVFHIELSNERMARTIAAETGARSLLFHACHNISKKDFDSGLTFLEIQEGNVPRLREALW